MNRKSLLTLVFILSLGTTVFSQNEAEKWGKISAADLAMTVYPEDSTAAAVILQDVGQVELRALGKYLVNFKQHRRIKVFDVKAFTEGNLLIPYYSIDGLEKIVDLDVQLILPNGEKQKVKSDNVFTEKLSKYRSAKKVFIPNLQKGCIIEYRFELSTETVQVLHDWYFQDDLPVRWSEVTVHIPPFFNYMLLTNIPRTFEVQETKNVAEYTSTRYGLGHLPAIRKEPFITTLDDYRAHIGFQLQTVNFPGQEQQKFMTNWGELAIEMEKWSGFGDQYKHDRNFNDMWKVLAPQLKPGVDPADTIAQRVLRFVTENITWNEEHTYYVEGTLDDAFNRKTGNSAELNLALVALLRKAGLNAVPMLISTRSNGQMFDKYPFRDQFNSVLAYLRKGDGGVVLDATNPYLPVGQAEDQHYNQAGWVVDSKSPLWEKLQAPDATEAWFGQMQLQESGELSGRFTININGALAADWRAELSHRSEREVLKENFATSYPEITFDSITITSRTNFDKPLQIKFFCRIPNAANVVNDFIYCRPVLDFFVHESPFKSLQRSYPVDFPYPVKMNYVLNLQLPPGYDVEELPEAARIVLPNEGGKISFSCAKSSPQLVQVRLTMNLSQATFMPQEYATLRKFFDLAAEKTQMQLVLKHGQ